MEVVDQPLDILAYVDSQYDDSKVLQNKVHALVRAEKSRMQREESLNADYYLNQLDPLDSPTFSTFVTSELQRCQTPTTPFNVKYIDLTPPKDSASVAEWEAALDKARALVEYHTTKRLNLELMAKFGKNAWGKVISAQEVANATLEARVKAAQGETEKVNLKRKLTQQAAAPKLQRLQEEHAELLSSNAELELQNSKLAAQLKRHKPN